MKEARLPIAVADVACSMAMLFVCVCVGLAVNKLTPRPVSLIYESKEQRLSDSVGQLRPISVTASQAWPKVLTLEEFRAFVEGRKGLVVDARPEIFYRLGHIPNALSLPRDAFKESYEKLRATLERNPSERIAVYCSGEECEDSTLVQSALGSLGYTNVAVFRGGWSQWTGEQLPTIQE